MKDHREFRLFEEGNISKITRESTERCVVLLFSANWLGSCYILERLLIEEGKAYPNVGLYKVDVDKNPVLKEKMDINKLPSTCFFINGEIVLFLEGLMSRAKIKENFALATGESN